MSGRLSAVRRDNFNWWQLHIVADQKAAEIFQSTLLIGFLAGFGFTFLICLKSFLN